MEPKETMEMVVCWTMSDKRSVPSQSQPKWWIAGRAVPPDIQDIMSSAKEVKTKNTQPPDCPKWQQAGAEALQRDQVKRRRLKIRPRTNLNGSDLIRSTFLVLTFTFTLISMATLVLVLGFGFLAPFSGSIFTFLEYNGEKRRILNVSGSLLFEAFGWTFARVYCGQRRRFAFYRFLLKPGIDCARRESR